MPTGSFLCCHLENEDDGLAVLKVVTQLDPNQLKIRSRAVKNIHPFFQ